jgi:hypothetical protein
MQNVPASTAVCPLVPGVPVRLIDPVLLLVKQGLVVSSEQQACEMPPFASMHDEPEPVTQAEPVQTPSTHVPLSHESERGWGPIKSSHGSGPSKGGASPVVSVMLKSRVVSSRPGGGRHADEREYCVSPSSWRTDSRPSMMHATPGVRAVAEHVPRLPMPGSSLGMHCGQTSVG